MSLTEAQQTTYDAILSKLSYGVVDFAVTNDEVQSVIDLLDGTDWTDFNAILAELFDQQPAMAERFLDNLEEGSKDELADANVKLMGWLADDDVSNALRSAIFDNLTPRATRKLRRLIGRLEADAQRDVIRNLGGLAFAALQAAEGGREERVDDATDTLRWLVAEYADPDSPHTNYITRPQFQYIVHTLQGEGFERFAQAVDGLDEEDRARFHELMGGGDRGRGVDRWSAKLLMEVVRAQIEGVQDRVELVGKIMKRLGKVRGAPPFLNLYARAFEATTEAALSTFLTALEGRSEVNQTYLHTMFQKMGMDDPAQAVLDYQAAVNWR